MKGGLIEMTCDEGIKQENIRENQGHDWKETLTGAQSIFYNLAMASEKYMMRPPILRNGKHFQCM